MAVAAGGTSVAYVFVHLLPEVAAGDRSANPRERQSSHRRATFL